MTSCPSQTQMMDLLDELLPAAEAAALDDHLSACRACRACREQLDELTTEPALAVCRSDERSDLTEEFLHRVGQSVRESLYGPMLDGAKAPAVQPLTFPPEYEILSELGRGGMGVVYQARQRNLGRLVALKMIQSLAQPGSDLCQRFRREAELVARLQHPHIVQIYAVGEHEGRPYLALEYLAGGTLKEHMHGPQSPRWAAEMVELLARAVQHAHERGVIHRDLKPANILLEVQGIRSVGLSAPKIADFGLAKHHSSDGLTRTGDIVGTPSYMAPEQAAGDARKIGPATDLYALGAILYELLTGRPPFQCATPLETLVQVTQQEPVSLHHLIATVPRDLETVCLKCLEKDPTRRYTSAAALADELRRYLDGRPIAARPAGNGPGSGPSADRLSRRC